MGRINVMNVEVPTDKPHRRKEIEQRERKEEAQKRQRDEREEATRPETPQSTEGSGQKEQQLRG